jgi:hypothetical protein
MLVLGLIMFAALLILILATAFFFIVGDLASHSTIWAYQVCTATGPLCNHPEWIGIAAGIVAALHVINRTRS